MPLRQVSHQVRQLSHHFDHPEKVLMDSLGALCWQSHHTECHRGSSLSRWSAWHCWHGASSPSPGSGSPSWPGCPGCPWSSHPASHPRNWRRQLFGPTLFRNFFCCTDFLFHSVSGDLKDSLWKEYQFLYLLCCIYVFQDLPKHSSKHEITGKVSRLRFT